MINFSLKTHIWQWSGDMPWHFVTISKADTEKLRAAFPCAAMVKVEARIEDIEWLTSLFYSREGQAYIMPIKKDIRQKLGLFHGEEVEVSIKVL